MAENAEVIDSGVQNQAPVVESVNEVSQESNNAPSVESAPQAPAEKMIPQSQVNRIAARESREAAEKARIDERARFERETGL